ncbi:MAG: hypothetical protein HC769_28870 [Cyanobacteria bacterium CRU_2_1]|nr:hypothetical protein [Cyanobacteria bacterium RU_5_0]NJR62466.1 hypothetical protein [Cyanobacteria bacterium CRU_2_1]
MKLPNWEYAIIESGKLTDYLLNINHHRGGAKAHLLIRCGYTPENWQQLESDIRQSHLSADVDRVRETPYGRRYEIRAALPTPIGEPLMVRTVWQIDIGQEYPRLITIVPD